MPPLNSKQVMQCSLSWTEERYAASVVSVETPAVVVGRDAQLALTDLGTMDEVRIIIQGDADILPVVVGVDREMLKAMCDAYLKLDALRPQEGRDDGI